MPKLRVVLATHGTTGDVQPMLALARELGARGHQATLAAPGAFADRARRLGIRFAPLGSTFEVDQVRAMADLRNNVSAVDQLRSWLDAVLPDVPASFRELRSSCAEADLLVSFPLQIAGLMAHEATGVRYASIHFSPFRKGATRLAPELTARVNEVRAAFELPALVDPLGAGATSAELALFAVSPHVYKRPASWPEHHRLCGYLFLEETWEPPRELLEFLDDGPPPVALSFGSVPHEDPERLTLLILEAFDLAGCRGILQRGYSGLGRGPLPSSVLALDFAPHAWLFPRASCVVHAGGAGTTHAAARAGVPSVVVPHWLDQPIWAALAHESGLAAAVVPYPRLTAAALATALRETMASTRAAEVARRTGEAMSTENGPARACELIEALCEGKQASGR